MYTHKKNHIFKTKYNSDFVFIVLEMKPLNYILIICFTFNNKGSLLADMALELFVQPRIDSNSKYTSVKPEFPNYKEV